MTGYNGIFNVTHPNNKFQFAKSITYKDGFLEITILKVAHEIENLSNEIRRTIIEEGHFTEVDYPFIIKPNFSTLGSIPEISRRETLISFIPDESIRDLSGFIATTLSEVNNLSPNAVDIITFDIIFFENDNAQGMIFKGKHLK